ncbi:hypothetical protein QYF61_018428 [Mycteria americana]|uniref:RNase H type-1 domain-containing protein n=1 Tax=Mycteria americana TaxID=33587 RepID=A0AAN7MJP1_MYCAM|nr:hypothetical protein QYF61_018428 [Mycteria americana]
MGKHRRWKAAVWSPIRQVVETAEGDGESSQFAEVKAIQLALDIAESEKWPVLYLYSDSWMGLWPKDKSTLEKVHLEASVAVDKSMLQQVHLEASVAVHEATLEHLKVCGRG